MTTKEMVAHWINERWKRRDKSYVSPDYRMNQIRFCNVHRENDKVTIALRKSWMKPEDNRDDLPLIGVLARRLNTVAAFENIPEYPEVYTANELYAILKKATEANGGTIINTQAYKIAGLMGNYEGSPDGLRSYPWALSKLTEKTAQKWLGAARQRFSTLEEAHKILMELPSIGSFMSAQVVADLKHTKYLADAKDWWTWAAIGPGSQRGLNWYFDGDEKGNTTQHNFLDRLHQMEYEVTPLVSKDIPRISAQDWQNICCEFDKYNRFYNIDNTGKQYRSR
jgi:hypothetical protein